MELNKYISYFPVDDSTKDYQSDNPHKIFDEDELRDILDRAKPDTWENKILDLNIDIQDMASPDTDDYKKLARVIRYLRGTVNMPLTLEADNLNIIKWWVDASFPCVSAWVW